MTQKLDKDTPRARTALGVVHILLVIQCMCHIVQKTLLAPGCPVEIPYPWQFKHPQE